MIKIISVFDRKQNLIEFCRYICLSSLASLMHNKQIPELTY